MSIAPENYSLIMRKGRLARRYPGGWDALVAENGAPPEVWSDDHLLRVWRWTRCRSNWRWTTEDGRTCA